MAGAQLKLGDLKSAVDTVCSFQDENDRTSALKELAALQIQEGEQEAALEILAVAIETLGGNRTSELAQIATLQAGAGADLAAQSTLTLALEATSNCNDEQERASQVARIAVAMVTAGFNEVAVETAETILTSREQFLPDVAAALVEAKDKEQFKRLLIPCAYHPVAAYRMCGLMARLYPEQADGIRGEIAKIR